MCGRSVRRWRPELLAYHHLGQRLQRGLQLVGGGQRVREVHGSGQQEQGGGDLLVQVELQPLPDKQRHVQPSKIRKGKESNLACGCRGYLAELLPQSLLRDSQRSHPSDPTGCLNLVHVQTLHAFLCNQLNTDAPGYEAPRRPAPPRPPATATIRTLSSARMARSFMMSWKRRKLFVPMDWSSRRRQRATS